MLRHVVGMIDEGKTDTEIKEALGSLAVVSFNRPIDLEIDDNYERYKEKNNVRKEMEQNMFDKVDKRSACPSVEDQDTLATLLGGDHHVAYIFKTIREMTLSGSVVSVDRVVGHLIRDSEFTEMQYEHTDVFRDRRDTRSLYETAYLERTFNHFGMRHTAFYDFVLEVLLSVMEVLTREPEESC